MTATMQARSIINTVSFLPEKNRKNTVRLQPTKGSDVNSWHEINMMWTKSWKINLTSDQLKRLGSLYLIPYRKRFVQCRRFMMLSASPLLPC